MNHQDKAQKYNNAQGTEDGTAQLTQIPQQGLHNALASGQLSAEDYEKLLAAKNKK